MTSKYKQLGYWAGVGVLTLLLGVISLEVDSRNNKTNIVDSVYYAKSKVDLGMNGVPVLDQGHNGSCVTFAVTAAVDALVGKGDYVSQLCLLQLGNYFEKNAYSYSGWNGSYGRLILGRIETFGLVSKQDQEASGCGGFKEYNDYKPNVNNTDMSVIEYKKLSKNILKEDPQKKGDLFWYPIADGYDTRHSGLDGGKVLQDVKSSLRSGDRVLAGFVLVDISNGVAGATDSYKANDDTWSINTNTLAGLMDAAGHEMVIIGYDDNAYVTTSDGKKHRGLIKLRNSWGTKVGDHGDFYMTYDYFKQFVLDAIVVSKLKKDL